MTIIVLENDQDNNIVTLQEEETNIKFQFSYEVYNCSMCQGDPHCRYDLKSCNDPKLELFIKELDEVELLDSLHTYGDHSSLCEELERVLEHVGR